MSVTLDTLDRSPDQAEEFSEAFLGKMFVAAQPGAVFGTPVVSGDYTVITASEVGAGGGFGSGRGTGTGLATRGTELGAPIRGEGGGMGGGGGASGRPIAVIVIGPNGVTVRPIFDITKIALAGITAWGAMLAMFLKMRAGAR
jgi:uncharacterized spore protein YtfJ